MEGCHAPSAFLSLVFRPAWSIKHVWRRVTKASVFQTYIRYLPTMEVASRVLEEQLSDLKMHLLGDYFPDGRHCNEVFDFLAYSLTGVWKSRTLLAGPLHRALLQSSDDDHHRRVPPWKSRRNLHPFPEVVAGQQLYGQALGT